ncbi:MAG: hypothetical protein V4722_23510 [Bacteroidota bacterium]
MKKIIAIIGVSAILFSCKKKTEDPQPPAQTKENIAGIYKVTALTFSAAGAAEADGYNTYIPACQRDDLQHLKADLSYSNIDAGTVCSPAGDKVGTWSLPATGKIIIDGQAADIVSFSGTALVISRVQSVLGTPTTFKFTLTKQ